MVRSLRRYLKNRGSAMFMVLSSMTALMVSCMAMYFAVVSSRDTQYAIFNQQQSYQSAMSIVDGIVAGLRDSAGIDTTSTENANFKNQLDELYKKMMAMKPGDMLSSNDNGFAAFAASAAGKKDDQNQVGSYALDITRLADEDAGKTMVWDIAIATSVNGSTSAYHQFLRISPGNGSPQTPAPMRLVEATGTVPNNSVFGTGVMQSDVFFDTEFAMLRPYFGTGNLTFAKGFGAKGSVELYYDTLNSTSSYTSGYVANWYIGKDLIIPSTINTNIKFQDGAKVIIGENFYAHRRSNDLENAFIYVIGDMYSNSQLLNSSKYFVDGDFYIEYGPDAGGSYGNIFYGRYNNVYVNGKVYYQTEKDGPYTEFNKTEKIANSRISIVETFAGAWTDVAGSELTINSNTQTVLTPDEAKARLKSELTSGNCPKWVVDDASLKTIENGPSFADGTSSSNTPGERTLSFDPAHEIRTIEYDAVTNDSCTIDKIDLNVSNGYGGYTTRQCALIVDTGDNVDNTYTIRVNGYEDIDGKGEKKYFSWTPFDFSNGARNMMDDRDYAEVTVNVYVKGKGSLVIDVPPRVIYQAVSYSQVMHYNMAILAGQNPESKEVPKLVHGDSFLPYIHHSCPENCTKCSYTKAEQLPEIGNDHKCSACGKQKVRYYCANHDVYSQEFCFDCDHDRGFVHWKEDGTTPYGICKDHILKSEARAAVDSQATAIGATPDKLSGTIVAPSVNIFLISSDESADIRLSEYPTASGDFRDVKYNPFCGFIYTPYMTLKTIADANTGDVVKIMGGYNVSDFLLNEFATYIGCWPETLPHSIMVNNGTDSIEAIGGDWKFDISY